MSAWTRLEVVEKVEGDLDLQEETFIQEDEMSGYINEAVRDARAIICNLEEDYYLTFANLALTNGEDEYSLPSNIYLLKIRGITYANGSRRYELKRIRNYKKFAEIVEGQANASSSDDYSYLIVNNSAADGAKLLLVPQAQETSASNVKIWHLRDAEEVEDDSDPVDVPEECINYVLAHVKRSCLAKMNNGVAPPEAEKAVLDQKVYLEETLARMVPDNDDEVEQDVSHYEDHS